MDTLVPERKIYSSFILVPYIPGYPSEFNLPDHMDT